MERRLLMDGGPGDVDGSPPVPASQAQQIVQQPVYGSATYPLTSIPVLNSDPGALATVYLDFHGEAAQNWGFQQVPATPAYDIDGDPTTFSSQELANIQEIWQRISEAYSPFNVNVTTVDPGNWDYAGGGNQNHSVREVIGGAGAWTGGTYGGIAYVGSYSQSNLPNTVYVFPSNLADGNTQYTADDGVHEIGHAFGLNHQSVYSGTTLTAAYNPGNGTTAPFMGNSLSNLRATWWYGQSSVSSTTWQDDLAVLGADDFGYRPQDHAQSIATANALTLSGTSLSGSGIIEKTTDTDFFSFTTGSGSVTLNASVAQYGPMLHAKLQLFDAAGNLLDTAADPNNLSQSITTTLVAGTYYLAVESYGQYGDVGQYTLSGTVPAASAPSTLQLSGSSISVTLNGSYVDTVVDGAASQYSLGQVSGIDISGVSGSSTATIDESHGILPSITISGCAINLVGSSGSDVVTISDSSIVYDSVGIALSNVSGITYNDGGGNDTITLAATLPVSLDVSGGNDTITIGGSPSTTSASGSINNSVDNAPSSEVSPAEPITTTKSAISSQRADEWMGIHQQSTWTSARAQSFPARASASWVPRADPASSSLAGPLTKQMTAERNGETNVLIGRARAVFAFFRSTST